MRETVLKSRERLTEFNICRLKELNEKFLTGHSMSAFIDFYKDEQSITHSLMEGCSHSKTANSVFEVLVTLSSFYTQFIGGNKSTLTRFMIQL